ncbi:hypothetical protein HYX70_02250 [Candidatus Saccharibacteria bacterium]|nr:hypothetical protein [Candidatus Saccharibacteria bacterium]
MATFAIERKQEEGFGVSTLTVLKSGRPWARITSLVSGEVCSVFIPPDSETMVNDKPLREQEAIDLAKAFKYPRQKKRKQPKAA